MELELARDVLDQELIDRNGTRMGRVDGLVIIIDDDGPPRVDRFELGFVVLARRLHPRVERAVQWLRRWSVRKVARQIIPWSSVAAITENHIEVGVDAMDTEAFAWERWLRDVIVARIPGSGDDA